MAPTTRSSAPAATAGVRSGATFHSYAQIRHNAARAARGLAELGVAAGDRVALLLRNDIPFVEATLATTLLNAVPVPINWHWGPAEVRYLLENSAARVLFVHEDLLAGVAAGIPDNVPVIVVPTSPEIAAAYGIAPSRRENGLAVWTQWLDALEPWDRPTDTTPVTSLIYTSGTTGRPKGVLRRPQSEASVAALRRLLGLTFHVGPGQRTIITAPMYHAAPNIQAMAAAALEMDTIIMVRFDAEELLRLIAEQRCTSLQLVPTMMVRLLQLPDEVRARYDVSSLEHVVHAAAPCPPEVKRRMIDWLGPIVTEYYGSTETGICTYCTSTEWLAHPGTVGRPVEGARVRILDTAGRDCAPGVSGDIHLRLPAWPDFTYLGDPEGRRAAERDGVVSTGDIGYLDEDGYLHLNDRRADMVISGGVNIYPVEIEACLLELAGVRDCAVFGIPDQEYGEALVAYIEPDPAAAPTSDQVKQHVRAALAGYKVPRLVQFSDALPREDSGKIFKRLLREPYWQGHEKRL